MGPSGSGKDSLIEAVRPHLAGRRCEVMRRVITRSAEAVGEDAVGVSREAFEALKAQGAFALDWQANSLAYGITVQLDDWLKAGHNVLVNGSRAHLNQARERYPDLLAIMLRVDTRVLQQRLQARGRETPAEICARLARNELFLDSVIMGKALLWRPGAWGCQSVSWCLKAIPWKKTRPCMGLSGRSSRNE